MEETKTFWTCPICNEQVEEQFVVGWNCQHNRDGHMAQGLSNSYEGRKPQSPPTRYPTGSCLRYNLVYIGKKEFHEGMRWGMLGDLSELFINQTKLEMYFCPACRHVEFFV